MAKIYVSGFATTKPGREHEFERTVSELVSVTAGDTGTAGFGFFHGDAPGTYHLIEVYEDSAAALDHIRRVEHLFPELRGLVDEERRQPLRIYGPLSEALRERYAVLKPLFPSVVAAL